MFKSLGINAAGLMERLRTCADDAAAELADAMINALQDGGGEGRRDDAKRNDRNGS
jgi:hypothetical protein